MVGATEGGSCAHRRCVGFHSTPNDETPYHHANASPLTEEVAVRYLEPASVSTKGREPGTSIGRRILLALLSLGGALIVMELLLASFFPQQTVGHVLAGRAGMFADDEVFLTELIPGFAGREREREFDVEVRLNAAGYRQAEFSPQAAGRRIVAIGDSFTFGHGVEGEEAYPRVLERILADRGEPAQVVNAGVPGRWVDEYYLELRERSLALAPDLVVVGFFVGNDIDGEDARTHVWRERDEQGRPLRVDVDDVRVEEGYRVQKVKKARWSLPIVRDSHLAQLVIDAARSFGAELGPPRLKEVDVFRREYTPETEDALSRVEDLLLAIRDLCRSHGADLLVVMIPMRQQIYPAERHGLEDLDWDKPQRLVEDFLTRSGIDWLDLRPALVAASDGPPLYFAIDSHWTPRGHAVAAEAIAEHVLSCGLVRRADAS